MWPDPVLLSRMQFGWVVGWHILLPAFTIRLASFIAFLEGVFALTRRPVFLNLSRFWLRTPIIGITAAGTALLQDAISPRPSATAPNRCDLDLIAPRCSGTVG
jgi:hypothetical protein